MKTVPVGMNPKVRGRVVNTVKMGSTLWEAITPALRALLARMPITLTLGVLIVLLIHTPLENHKVVPIALRDPTVLAENVRHRHATHAQRAKFRAREAPVGIAR